jgi:AcrR family transcriptional regulator
VASSANLARDQMLERCIEFLLQSGFSDLSLRQLASGVGTSHRMLLYHFGSRAGLLANVVTRMEETQRTALTELTESTADVRTVCQEFWRRISAPDLAPAERLFFEVYAHALRDHEWSEQFRDSVIAAWEAPLMNLFLRAELVTDRAHAKPLARLFLAVARGLLLDLLVTGERRSTDKALDLFLSLIDSLTE